MANMKRSSVGGEGSMPDHRFEVENDEMKATLRSIAKKVGSVLDPEWGFTLFLFEFGEGGSMFYISSAERGDVLDMVETWLKKQRGQEAGDGVQGS